MKNPGFVVAMFRLTRFWNLVIVALTQYCTAGFLVSFSTLTDWRLLLLASSTVMIAAAGYIINDYYDVKIDLVNKPDRVVVGKWIPRRFAILFHSVLSITGTAIGFWLSVPIGLINFFCAFLLWVYSNQLKRQPFIGNLTIALLTGCALLLVEALYHSHNIMIWIYALFAFFITLAREIIKDMEDLKGDNTFGCRTLPIVWGIRRAKNVIYVLLGVFALSVIYLDVRFQALPLIYFLPALFLPLIVLTVRLARADTIRDFYWLSQWCKLIMLLGVASMAFLS